MATIVTSKIGLAGGPTRDYTSIQAWEDACPANLVTVDQVWKGVGYNDGELIATAVTTISGTTTDATRYLWLTAAPGHSFDDNPGKLTNRLAYVAANGVALRVTAAYSTVLDVLTPYTRIDGWQFQCSAANSYGLHLVAGANFAKIANCIVQSRDGAPLRLSTGSQTATNCLAIANSAVGRGLYLESGASVYNCTVVRPSNFAASSDAVYSVYGAATIKNCAFFGFTTLTGTFSADGHNVTSSTVVPGTTGSLANKVYANQFVQSSTAGGVEDFRVKAGADLIGAGVQDTANTADLDIVGQARSTTAPTVGAWEYVAAGGGVSTYSYTSTGGIVFSGTITKVRGATRTATGGLQMSGAAPASRGTVRTPAGGLVIGGAATLRRGRAIAPSGGLSLAGTAGLVRGAARAAAGGIQFAGAAATSFFSAVQSRVVNPVGGLLFAGSAAVGRSVRKVASGGIAFSGHALMRTGPLSAILSGILPIFRRRRR